MNRFVPFLLFVFAACWLEVIGFATTGTLKMSTRLRGHSVGIDLGTTFSLVSVIHNAKPKLLQVDGSVLVPSVVSYTADHQVLVGTAAKANQKVDPKNTFSSIKRLMGRSMDDLKGTNDLAQFGNKVFRSEIDLVHKRNFVAVDCPNLRRAVTPVDISAHILRHLLSAAQAHYGGERITNAVITVPAYFRAYQREVTRQAGLQAGLQKVKLLAEPEAAAFAFGLDKEVPQLVLVFDLGGGTFDVSILDVGDGMAEVIATSGDSHLGGDDFDQCLLDWAYREIAKHCGLAVVHSIRSDLVQQRTLRALCIEAKVKLSKDRSVSIALDAVQDGLSLNITRSKFNDLTTPLLTRLMRPLREVALMAGVNLPGESGFSTETDLEDDHNNPPVAGSLDANEEFDAVQSLKRNQLAGRQRAKRKKKDEGTVFKEIRRLQKLQGDPSLTRFPGGLSIDNVILVGGATRMPCIVNLVRTITQKDPQRFINPDEAVCLGAGIVSGILDGCIDDMQIVNPFQAALLRFVDKNQ
jgi:molecular chaperone DnaK (HSP70)